MSKTVWFVTGTSSGFGLATVRELLKQGYQVAATTRSVDKLLSVLANDVNDNLFPLQVDLANETSIKAAIQQTIDKFGQIDVVVNNAGYAQGGVIEDVSRDDIVQQFQVNLLAVHSVIQNVLPHFRSRKTGFILNISSAITLLHVPGLGIYAASKAALTAFSDVLRVEVAGFGVKVTTILPGPFNTGFGQSARIPAIQNDAYRPIYEQSAKIGNVKFPGSVDLSAKLFIELANNPNPPQNIFLGKEANERAIARSQSNLAELKEWQAIGSGVDVE
jgi:NAD(P)-dependent dehydrogenase (short-subunit alcohol dehydrogenase family)